MRRRASNAFRSWISASVVLALAGCDPQAETPRVVIPARSLDLRKPEPPSDQALTLILPNGRVHVGDPDVQAASAVNRPNGAYDLRDRPPITGEGLRFRGWRSEKQSLAIVSRDGRVVLALYLDEAAQPDTLTEVLHDHEGLLERFESKVVTGSVASYWFWENDGQRLMICRSTDRRGRTTLALSIGVVEAMDALRMSPTDASSDALQAQRMIEAAKTQ